MVTALCLTRDRRNWLPQAIRNWQLQTYPDRELLIVADGADVSDLVPLDQRIRLIGPSGAATIGAKRNFGCAAAHGQIICHWDDDDWNAPERIADQVARLLTSGKAVTGYHTMRFTTGAQWWRFKGTPNYALGTSLCYLRTWWMGHRFQELQVGEDNSFVFEAATAQQLATADAGELMHATIHAGNTSPREIKAGWERL